MRRVRELKELGKVSLPPGESQVVRLPLTAEALTLWNARLEFAVEPQDITVSAGPSSQTAAHALLRITPGDETAEA